MKIEAYQCKHCEGVYLEEDEMKQCEEACSEEIKEYKERQSFKEKQKSLQDSVRLESESVEEICRRCIEVQNEFAEHDGSQKLISMKLDVRYNPHASNSHSSPINGVGNFSRKSGLPTGYPALLGRVKFEYEKRGTNGRKNVGENILRFINKGSGGGDGYNLSYGVTLWLDDFPLIKKKVEECLQEEKRLNTLVDDLETQYQQSLSGDKEVIEINSKLESVHEKIYQLQKVENELEISLSQKKRVHKKSLLKVYEQECELLSENPFGIQVPYLF